MKKLIAAISLAAVVLTGAFALEKSIADNEKVEKVAAITSVANTKGTKIYVVGDSTFSAFNDGYFYPRYGIGTKMQDYLDPKKVEVINLAMSGRSSKSFLTEANYKTLVNNIKKGDYLVVGFGHNDEKTEEARFTDPNGSKETKGSFKNSLYENYVKLAKDKGATPVLCTPIVRRAPGKAYEGSYVHVTKDSGEFKGGDYAKAIRELAAECGIPCVDNTEYTKKLYEEIGDEGSLKMHAWLGHKPGSVDNTHLNVYGATKMAYVTVTGIAKQDKKFAKFVVKGASEPVEALVLEQNPNYIIPTYEKFNPDTDKSGTFVTTAPWYGTVFGDCGGAEKISDPELYEIIEENGKVIMHSGTKDGKTAAGKIASGSDGLAFYFQMLPRMKDFTFTAKAKVLNYTKNNQVSFGIMVRDDVYIDKFDNQIKSNYVAAGALGLAKENFSSTFMRNDGDLKQTAATIANPKVGDTYELKLTKKGDKVTAQFGKDAPVEYELSLVDIDKTSVYVGLYTVRSAYVEFSDISLK